jgi:RNA polymerase sigma-70 factor, ECF subfamily
MATGEHDDELALAKRAADGDAAAVREIERLIADEVGPAVRKLDASDAFADEVRQAVRVRLLVADGGRVRIADYAGRGPLRGWIAVAATRVALNLKRGARPTSSQDVLAELVSGETDPELRYLKTLYRAEFREAIEAALAGLPERPRALLRLAYVDGLKMYQLAQLYGVHETTAARWVTKAAADVADAARKQLLARLALSPSSLDSVARMVLSNLELSIARVLGG